MPGYLTNNLLTNLTDRINGLYRIAIDIMIQKVYWLQKDQFLGKLEPFKTKGLPTDSYIEKEVTGCGATHLELHFKRNSIIVEHNLPVIHGKSKKMNGSKKKYKIVLGVDEHVDVERIRQYIANREGYKKIITTPEGFWKVMEAIGESVYNDYFLLFDECEKAIQDVVYREDIISPFDVFFSFKGKALISATPIMPSDPRFANFTHVMIKPAYDHAENITVSITNNIVYQLKVLLDQYSSSGADEGRNYFIFFKSTKRIKNVIRGLRLNDYAVYCSEKSAKDLKNNGIEHAYDKVNDKFAKYNFLTSRYFSAVDIDYEHYHCDPIIIMVSDVLAVQHSSIDPATEAVQIVGRFRKPEHQEGKPKIIVKKDIYHISNYLSKLTSFNETEIMAILEDKRRLHKFISTFKPNSDIEYFNEFIKEILKMNGFSYFLRDGNGELNYFMVDNFKYTEEVKGYYRSSKSLIKKYKSTRHFKVSDDSSYTPYRLTDQELREINDNTAYQTTSGFVSKRLKEIMQDKVTSFSRNADLALLRFSYPKQMSIVDEYTLENAAELDYNINTIEQRLKDAKGLKRLLPIIKYIQRAFRIDTGYSSEEIGEILRVGIDETGLTGYKPDVKLLKNAAILSDRHTIKDAKGSRKKGYFILGFLHKF